MLDKSQVNTVYCRHVNSIQRIPRHLKLRQYSMFNHVTERLVVFVIFHQSHWHDIEHFIKFTDIYHCIKITDTYDYIKSIDIYDSIKFADIEHSIKFADIHIDYLLIFAILPVLTPNKHQDVQHINLV